MVNKKKSGKTLEDIVNNVVDKEDKEDRKFKSVCFKILEKDYKLFKLKAIEQDKNISSLLANLIKDYLEKK